MGIGTDGNVYGCYGNVCKGTCWGSCLDINSHNTVVGNGNSNNNTNGCNGTCKNVAMFGDAPIGGYKETESTIEEKTETKPSPTPEEKTEPTVETANTCTGTCSGTCSGYCDKMANSKSICNQCEGNCLGGCSNGCYKTNKENTSSNSSGDFFWTDISDSNDNGVVDSKENPTNPDFIEYVDSTIPEHRGCGVCTSSCAISCGNAETQEVENIEDLSQAFSCDSCQGSCVQYCSNCEGTCSGGCTKSCSYFCNAGCEDESKTIPKLKAVMDAENIKDIFDFLVKEAERRKLIAETEWEETIKMIVLASRIGQEFYDQEAVWDSIWDINDSMINNQEMQRLATIRQQKINRNQVEYHTLTDDSIVSSAELLQLLIMPTRDTQSSRTVSVNKSKQALLNDILFNRNTLTIQNYKKAINGTYESILEQEGKHYFIDFLSSKDIDIYAILMILYIAYNGQEGLNDRIFQIFSSERINYYGRDTLDNETEEKLSNYQLINLLTLKKTDNNNIKLNKQILISEYLYYIFSPELLKFDNNTTIVSLGIMNQENSQNGTENAYSMTVQFNDTEKRKKYTFPKIFEEIPHRFIDRLSHYYYFVSGSRVTNIFRTRGLINNPRAASIINIENQIKELTKNPNYDCYSDSIYTGANSSIVNTLKNKLKNLTINEFLKDKEKYDWIEDYSREDRRKHKEELQKVVLSKSLFKSIENINYILESNNLNINPQKAEGEEKIDPYSHPYFISLESAEKIISDNNFNESAKNYLYDLQKIAYRMLLYYFQYGGFYYNNQKIDNLEQAYPYFIELKQEYNNKASWFFNNLSNGLSDKQIDYIKNNYYTNADDLVECFDNSNSSILYTCLLLGTNEIINRSSKKLKQKRFGYENNIIPFENIHINESHRDYFKNPAHDLTKVPPGGGRTGFMYEIYSVVMLALLREHGLIIMYAEEKSNELNPYRELFKIVADERIKILGEKEISNNLAYDSNLKYSKLLHHNAELTENEKVLSKWDGYITYTLPNNNISHFTVTSGYAYPDWRRLNSILGSYPAPTEAIINALNYSFYQETELAPEYSYITDKNLLAFNKNRLFTDVYCSNFEKINLFTGTPPYCMSINNTNLVLAIKTYDYRNISEIYTQNLAKNYFNEENKNKLNNFIYKEIVLIKYKYDNVVDTQFYLIYDLDNNNNLEWKEYNPPEGIQFNNLFNQKLIGKTMTVPYQFDIIGQIGYLNEEIKNIPESYKEIINSLDNYGNGLNYITENNVPMVLEDILVNILNVDLGDNYQSATLTQKISSQIITTILGKNYNGANYVTENQYNALKEANIDVEKYFQETIKDSAGKQLYIMKERIEDTNLNTRELVFKDFYNMYHKNAYEIDRSSINNLSQFDRDEKRNTSAKIFSFGKWQGANFDKWEKIATALRDEKIEIHSTGTSL